MEYFIVIFIGLWFTMANLFVINAVFRDYTL